MRRLRRLLFILFFLSGLAALVYEVVWARKLSLIFGTTTYGVSSILAVFFAGLALGSWIFGKWIDKGREPLKTYAFLELGIGIYAAFTPLIFKLIEGLQVAIWQQFEPSYSSFSIFTFLLAFLGLIIPTTLMGGTLPVLSKFWVRCEEEIGSGVGALYFINTAGAVLGTFLAGFFLIAYLGVNQAIWLAALINLLIGIVILVFRGGYQETKGERQVFSEKLTPKPYTLNPILIAFALAGFAALALEVLWTRVLVMTIGGSIYAFTLVLIAFLLGIALGSAIMSRFTDRLRNSLIWFSGIEILLGISVILLTPLLSNLPFWFLSIYQSFSQSFVSLQFGLFLLTLMVMLLPTFLMGAAFPIVIKAYKEEQVGSRVGKVYTANTIGGIFGALAAGFVFIPLIGVQKGIWVAGSVYLLIGVAMLWLSYRSKFVYISVTALALLSLLLGFRLPSWDKSILTFGFYANPYDFVGQEKEEIKKLFASNKILFYKEGPTATVAVHQDLYEGILSLRINGKADASTAEDMENQLLAGHIPMLLHPKPESVLVVGMGSGITLGSVVQYPAQEIDAIEIEPAVVEAAKYFAEYSHNALEDPRVNIIVTDGRNLLLATDKRYDVITSEPSNPWLTGSSKLFTQEYFQLMKEHLTEKGVALQWINLYSFDEEDLRTLVATFRSVFPNALAFNVLTSDDLLLVGGKDELVLDLEQIGSKMRQEKVKADLGRIAIEDPLELLAYLTMDGEVMEKFAKETPLNTDNHPILEFSAPKSLYVPTRARNLRVIMEYWVNPLTLIDADRARMEELVAFREHFAKMMIAYTESNFGEGIAEGEKARAIKSNHPGLKYLSRLYFETAYFLVQQQKGQEAKQALLRSLEIKPVTQTRLILGSIYIDEGRLSEAQEQFEKAVETSPEMAVAHFNLGLILEQTGDLNRAIEEFERTVELDSEYREAHEELVKLYEMRGDYGRAEEHRKLIREFGVK